MITAVVPGEPGQPVAVSVTAQLVGYDRHGTPEARELQQVHLEQVPAGTGLREVAARVADLHAVRGPAGGELGRRAAAASTSRSSAPCCPTCSAGTPRSASRSPAGARRG